jgi:hypothetical protein
MARRLNAFPASERRPGAERRYPWDEWSDGAVWEIRRGADYDIKTENMRTNVHMRASALAVKARTKKINDQQGEGLVLQFFDPEADETEKTMQVLGEEDAEAVIELLYADALNIYERARHEVTIPRSDGTTQKYAATRYRRQIESGYEKGELVPTVARIVRKPTLGFGHLENAGRPDLMVETLVLDDSKPYHRLFSQKTVGTARSRMRDRGHLD